MEKIKIAIIDDETEYVEVLAKGLEIFGYDVFSAIDGASGIDIIAKNKPDIVLCDYKLGDMDGVEVIKKTRDKSNDMVYIVVTAYFDEAMEGMFKKAGAAKVIYKPIQLLELNNTIRDLLTNRGIK